jgi:transmembrane sensor
VRNLNMQDLFNKYVNNDTSPEEVQELLGYFTVPENEIKLRELISDSLDFVDDDVDNIEWNHATDEMFAGIKKQVTPEKGKVVSISVRRLPWVAAVVLIVGVSAVYTLIKNKNHQQEIVNVNTSKSAIAAGNNKAVLTLADGSNIILEAAADGILLQQGSATIIKVVDGELAYTSTNDKPTKILFNSIAIPRGGQYKVTLSDGSKVWLNAASSLRFPADFKGNERKVELSGEAYFEVAKNAAMPFKVEVAGKGEVEVLGTHFNVNAYPDEATVKTTLLEGRVKVMGLAGRRSSILYPGEQAQLDSTGQLSINKNVDTEHAIAWKNGNFNFSNANIEIVLRQLSRWYDVDIVFEGPVPQKQFNGEISRDLKLFQVLKLLEGNNVFCRLEGKTLIVLK